MFFRNHLRCLRAVMDTLMLSREKRTWKDCLEQFESITSSTLFSPDGNENKESWTMCCIFKLPSLDQIFAKN